MTFFNIQLLILIFVFGVTIGCITAYFFMKRAINKNMRSIANLAQILNNQKSKDKKEFNARRENILLLAEKLKQIESSVSVSRKKEISKHIDKLNQLLSQTGISEIEKDA